MPLEVPIIGAKKNQKLIVEFIKNPQGHDEITFSFDPQIDIPVEGNTDTKLTPEQHAALNVANTIIQAYGLNQAEGDQNVGS